MPEPSRLWRRRFGRLKVIRLAKLDERGKTPGRWWWCRCDCGTECPVAAMWLLARKRPTQSCGCLLAEHAARNQPTAVRAASAARTEAARARRNTKQD